MSSPTRGALIVSAAYLLLGSAWIVVSGVVAESGVITADELAQIEKWKGLAFMLVTSGLLFVFCRNQYRRLQRNHEVLLQRNRALELADRRSRSCLVAATLLHDCRNIMTVVAGATGLIRAQVGDNAEVKDVLVALEQAIDRVVSLAGRIKDNGDIGVEDRLDTLDLAELARHEVALLRRHERVRNCALTVVAPEPVQATVYRGRIEQLLFNLVLNAAEAMSGSGPIEVRVRRDGDEAMLEVEDGGPGIPPAQRERIFIPYVTTKSHGTGLGLPSVEACVLAHGGRVEVGDAALGGARFTVRLPLRGPEARDQDSVPHPLSAVA